MPHIPMNIPKSVYSGQDSYAAEKTAEEQTIRRQWEQQLQAAEAQARSQFEQDLVARKSAARTVFMSSLATAKTESDFLKIWGSEETKLRSQFSSDVASKRAEAKIGFQQGIEQRKGIFQVGLETGIREAKRQTAMRGREQLSPRLVRSYRATEQQLFGQAVQVESEVFGKKTQEWEAEQKTAFETSMGTIKKETMTAWKTEMQTWEEGEKGTFESSLQAWESEERAALESQISGWKATEKAAKLEPAIKEWSAAWQPKGAAERLMDFASGIAKPFELSVTLLQVPTAKGTLTVGFDVGKFFQGLAQGTVVAASGVVASGESLAYGIANLAGLIGGFEVKTPRAPPTAIGSGISSIIYSVQKGKAAWSPEAEALGSGSGLAERGLGQFGFTYEAATILGDLLISYGTGKAAEKLIMAPLSKTRIGTAMGETFKAHAPKSLLKIVYGKKGTKVIVQEKLEKAIEAQWGWEPLDEALIGSEKAIKEAQYGMPFYRQQSLHMPMPVTEMQRLRLDEWLAPRMEIEAQLGWELGVSPAHAIIAGKEMAAKPLSLSDMLEQAESMPVYKTEKLTALSFKEGKLQEEVMKAFSVPTGKTTPYTYRASFEFEQATKMQVPSRLFIPKSPKMVSWIEGTFYGRGTQMTPMETTLSKAMMGEVSRKMGGMAFAQLAPQILKEFPVMAPTLETTPKALVKIIPRGNLSAEIFKGAQVSKASVKLASSLTEALGLSSALLSKASQTQAQIPSLSALQALGLKQIQQQGLKQKTVQITGLKLAAPEKPSSVFAPPLTVRQPTVPTRMAPPRRRKEEDLLRIIKVKERGRGWKKKMAGFLYPVMSESEVSRYVLGKQKVRHKRK